VVHTAPPSKQTPQTTENEENEGERLSPNSKHSSQNEVIRNYVFSWWQAFEKITALL